VVLPFIQLIDSLATFKMIAAEQASLFKLSQNTVHGGQTNFSIVLQEVFENILCAHVPLRPFLKDFQNLLSGDSGFESSAFEFVHEK
jgi:hypothetical protein